MALDDVDVSGAVPGVSVDDEHNPVFSGAIDLPCERVSQRMAYLRAPQGTSFDGMMHCLIWSLVIGLVSAIDGSFRT